MTPTRTEHRERASLALAVMGHEKDIVPGPKRLSERTFEAKVARDSLHLHVVREDHTGERELLAKGLGHDRSRDRRRRFVVMLANDVRGHHDLGPRLNASTER